jgi:hypothetical protein
MVMGRRVIFVLAAQGEADGCHRLSVGVTGEISLSDGRSGGGWQEERVGHELSSPIEGTGHDRGWQPGSKVSTMIMRPPQQGQGFRASSAGVGHAKELAGQCDAAGPIAVGQEAIVTDAVKPVGQHMTRKRRMNSSTSSVISL